MCIFTQCSSHIGKDLFGGMVVKKVEIEVLNQMGSSVLDNNSKIL